MNYQTIKVNFISPILFIQFYRPDSNNTINDTLVEECHHALTQHENIMTILVLEGLPEIFCFGADFQALHSNSIRGKTISGDPEPVYDLWLRIATGPYVSISYVRGKANAGGVGFVAASDIVLADHTATFSLSEMLFGFFPACVLPFLVRRIGYQKANYMTMTTEPISVQRAKDWGLVDEFESESNNLLRKQLLRLRKLHKKGIVEYRSYMKCICNILSEAKPFALSANRKIFTDADNKERIFHWVENGETP